MTTYAYTYTHIHIHPHTHAHTYTQMAQVVLNHPVGFYDITARQTTGHSGIIEERPKQTLACMGCAHDKEGNWKSNGSNQHIHADNLQAHLDSRRHLERLQAVASGERIAPRVPAALPMVIPSALPRIEYFCRACSLDLDGTLHHPLRCHIMTAFELAAHVAKTTHERKSSVEDGRLIRCLELLYPAPPDVHMEPPVADPAAPVVVAPAVTAPASASQ